MRRSRIRVACDAGELGTTSNTASETSSDATVTPPPTANTTVKLDSLGRPRVRMAMVRVRPVRMGVAELGVPVLVHMGPLDSRVARGVVIVMGIVSVAVRMDDGLVSVRMLMTLASEEPGGAEDEGHGGVGRHRRRLAKDRQRQPGREERRRAEQGPRAGGTQLSQRADEERDARPVACCTEGKRRQRET